MRVLNVLLVFALNPEARADAIREIFTWSLLAAMVTGCLAANVVGLVFMHYGAPYLPVSAYFCSPPHLLVVSMAGAWLGMWLLWVWTGEFDEKPEE